MLVNALLAFILPLDDWQFWVATLISLVALYAVLRMLLPGAPMLTRRELKLEKPVRLSELSVAATAITFGAS